ncbi:GIY-YIG nuclease family protein [Amphiplicatus metriothermophilus]|uniref:GIY-YIG nuclease family protein n=1 Tax=Amphiplicatus metriothermophilus TaxID=1519374 RepID=UPI001C872B57
MWYAYILQSIGLPKQLYFGATRHLQQRLTAHNPGKSAHAANMLLGDWRDIALFQPSIRRLSSKGA